MCTGNGRRGYQTGRYQNPAGAMQRPADTEEQGYFRVGDQDMEYARTYIKFQRYENIYDEDMALARGTAFADLDMPNW